MRLALFLSSDGRVPDPPLQLWATDASERGFGAVLVGQIELAATSLGRVVEGAKRLGRLLGSLVLGASLLVRRRDFKAVRAGFAEGFREGGGLEV